MSEIVWDGVAATGAGRARRWQASLVTGLIVGGLGLSPGCSSSSPKALPDSLYGTWQGGNDKVTSVRFSSGGSIELNGKTACDSTYTTSAIDGGRASVRSGYLNCDGIMDGYLTAEVTVTDKALTASGYPIGGTYVRGYICCPDGPNVSDDRQFDDGGAEERG